MKNIWVQITDQKTGKKKQHKLANLLSGSVLTLSDFKVEITIDENPESQTDTNVNQLSQFDGVLGGNR